MARHAAVVGIALLALTACADEPNRETIDVDVADRVPIRTLAGPDLEIGELEGGGDQTLDLVTGVALLGDGRVAVLDQGPASVFVYDESGRLVETFGGEGDGPGEFRAPADIRVLEGDSVRVLDTRGVLVTLFSPEMEYVREFPPASPLAGRFILEGEVTEEEREAALAILRRRPFPVGRTGFRLATLADDGRVWVRERVASADAPALWFVLDHDGTPVHAIEVPERFRPMYMMGDEVVGRWRGEYDVHYVHRYRTEDGGRTIALPDWLAGPVPASPAPPMPDSIVRGLQSMIRNAATMQEIYYSDHFAYSAQVDSMIRAREFEVPEGLGIDVLHATARSWAMVVTVAGHSGMCTIKFGAEGPATLRSGAVVCGN